MIALQNQLCKSLTLIVAINTYDQGLRKNPGCHQLPSVATNPFEVKSFVIIFVFQFYLLKRARPNFFIVVFSMIQLTVVENILLVGFDLGSDWICGVGRTTSRHMRHNQSPSK